jgi:hypothetical protein
MARVLDLVFRADFAEHAPDRSWTRSFVTFVEST